MASFKTNEIIHDSSGEEYERVKRTSFPHPIKIPKTVVGGYPVPAAEVYISHRGGPDGRLRGNEIAHLKNTATAIQKTDALHLRLKIKLITKKIQQLADDPSNMTVWKEYEELCKGARFDKALAHEGRDIYEYAASKSGGRFSIGKKALEDTPTPHTPVGEGGK
jgi:hypothetical protein